MKYAVFLAFAALCSCADLREGSSCNQPKELWGYVENRTGQAQNVTFSYADVVDSKRKIISVSIPSGGTLEQKLSEYSVEISGTSSMSGPRNASCNPIAERSATDLHLVQSSFSNMKNCAVGGDTGLVYLIANTDTCPAFTTQQEVAQ